MAAVAELPLIHGEGRGEHSWRPWLAQAGVREIALQDCLPSTSRLVVVAPHPDDEVLACGGLLSMHAESGGAVLLVAVTDGEASHRGSTVWTRTELARQRCSERLQGLERLGLPAPEIARLALPDGHLAEHMAPLRSGLLALLQADDVLVSTWPHDGHPDHEATGRAARMACLAVGCTFIAAPVWMWHWAATADLRVPWRLLRALPLSDAVVARKLSALAAHRSQLGPRDGGAGPVLGSAIRARVAWPAEYYFV